MIYGSIDALNEATRNHFPEQWANIEQEHVFNRSKKRYKLRQRYLAEIEFDNFLIENPTAYCANCKHSQYGRHGERTFCDFHSDSGAYAFVAATFICGDWKPKTDPQTPSPTAEETSPA